MKRILLAAVAAFVLYSQMVPTQAVGLSAQSAILIEADSGRVLYEQNADEKRLIASTTKLMTALVALESGHDVQEVVTIEPEDTRTEGSSLYLKEGEQLTLETLLYGLLLHSGNDAALAIARYCRGSVEAFVEDMNEMTKQLHMTNSHFENPNGLNGETHYSTARDMAKLAQACLQQETLAEIVATRSISMEGRSFQNHNKLLWQYEGCIGMKTGYTELAGRTLVSAAQRDGMTLIAVTLNAPDDWNDHKTLFDYGFSNYRMEPLVEQGQQITTMPVSGSALPMMEVIAAEDFFYPLKDGESLEQRCDYFVTSLTAPVLEGEQVGTLSGWVNGVQVAAVPLVCGSPMNEVVVEQKSPIDQFLDWLNGM